MTPASESVAVTSMGSLHGQSAVEHLQEEKEDTSHQQSCRGVKEIFGRESREKNDVSARTVKHAC